MRGKTRERAKERARKRGSEREHTRVRARGTEGEREGLELRVLVRKQSQQLTLAQTNNKLTKKKKLTLGQSSPCTFS